MLDDLRFALRQLRKSLGFTSVAVTTLALGIGLNTGIFSLVNDLFLRGLPFEQPDRIVRIYNESKERNLTQIPYSVPRFRHYRDGQTVFDGLAADTGAALTLTGLGDPVQLNAASVTANYFEVLGVRPIRGRTFLPAEEETADVAMITRSFWLNRLQGDPNVIGRTINLDGVVHTIVGVLPNLPVSWFGPSFEVCKTKPFELPGFTQDRLMRGVGYLRVIGRMKAGVTFNQVQAAMPSLAQSYREQNPERSDSSWTTSVITAAEDVSGNLRSPFGTLLGAVGFVLLIACSNVANLLLVRFSGRRREIALRLALGATRSRIVRLFIFESTLMSVIAGILGALLAWRLIPLVPKIASNFLPLESDFGETVSLPVLAFTFALSLLTGLVMGVYPALQSSRADLVDGLKDGGRGMSGSIRQQRFRKVLVGAQVALSVALLAGAALLITSFVHLSRQGIGFRSDHLWVGGLALASAHYPDTASRQRFVEQLGDSLKSTPGIESVAISSSIPLTGNGSRSYYARAEGEVLPVTQRPVAPTHNVAPGYFRSLGIPLLAGRDFDERDTADRPKVIMISQSGARKLFGTADPVGHSVLIGSNQGSGDSTEIIGVVGNVRSGQVAVTNEVEFYRPWSQENFAQVNLGIRSSQSVEAVSKLVRLALGKIDPGLPIAQPESMEVIVRRSLEQARLMMSLLGIFAGIALLLATVGIYGAVAYTVEQRTSEIGVRMALGAQTMDVMKLVVTQGMKPVTFGLAAGLAAALALGRLLTSQLYQTSPFNPLLLTATLAILAVAAMTACLLPARRATLVDPIQALRIE